MKMDSVIGDSTNTNNTENPDTEAKDNTDILRLNYDAPSSKGEMTVKVICLGDSAVGKSKLLERFLINNYKPKQVSTYALTLYRYNATVNEDPVVVDFWDTAGQERFQSLHPSYYHQAHACIMVFDATRKVTYKNLTNWYEELKRYRPEIPCFCAANKIDANMDITTRKLAFPEKNNIPLYYVSASDGTNVVKLFRDAINSALCYKKNPTDFTDEVLAYLENTIEDVKPPPPNEDSPRNEVDTFSKETSSEKQPCA